MSRTAVLSLAWLLIATRPVHADPIIASIDDPSIMVQAGPSGVSDFAIAGSLGLARGYFLTDILIYDAVDPTLTHGTDLESLPYADYSPADDGGSYRGTLLELNVSPGTPDGLYDYNPASPDGLPEVVFVAEGPGGVRASGAVDYSVTVFTSASPSAVPEPCAAALLGLGLAACLARWHGRTRHGTATGG